MYICLHCRRPLNEKWCAEHREDARLPAGEGLVDWTVDRMLDQGGQARVFKCRDGDYDRAVKLVDPRRLGPAARREAERDFDRRVRALRELTHPNVIALIHAGSLDGLLYMTSEFVPSTLREVMQPGKPMPLRRAVRVATQLIDALTYVHDRNIIHRDIKPENIGLDGNDRVRLFDFGLAGFRGLASGPTTVAGVRGSFAYGAPEQLMRQKTGTWSDIYAFGAVLYEMLAGRSHRPVGLENEVATFVTQDAPPLPADPERPAELDALILKCLEPVPGDRIQEAWPVQAVLADLNDRLQADFGGTYARWNAVGAELKDLEADHTALRMQIAELKKTQQKLSAATGAEERRLADLGERRAQAQAAAAELEARHQAATSAAQAAEVRQTEAARGLAEADRQTQAARKTLAELEAAVASRAKAQRLAEDAHAHAVREHAQKAKDLDGLKASIRSLQGKREIAEERRAAIAEEAERAEAEFAERQRAQARALEKASATLAAHRASAQAGKNAADAELAAHRSSARSAMAETEAELTARRQAIDELRPPASKVLIPLLIGLVVGVGGGLLLAPSASSPDGDEVGPPLHSDAPAELLPARPPSAAPVSEELPVAPPLASAGLPTAPASSAPPSAVRHGDFALDKTDWRPALLPIKAGKFKMGSPEGEEGRDDDEAQVDVELTRAFLMMRTEVTQGQWKAVMGTSPSYFEKCGADCPVERVSWYDAVAYANRLSEREGLTACYAVSKCKGEPGTGCPPEKDGSKDSGCDADYNCTVRRTSACTGYRLPTEAEWEYAARAGSTDARYGPLDGVAWHGGNAAGKTHAVGGKQANRWGLVDMLGNVWEWTDDWYAGNRDGGKDPSGPSSGDYRVVRGGSWSFSARWVRAASRVLRDPVGRYHNQGFRLVRPPSSK